MRKNRLQELLVHSPQQLPVHQREVQDAFVSVIDELHADPKHTLQQTPVLTSPNEYCIVYQL